MRFTPFRHWPSVLWKRRPIQLTFFVTRRCNARCPFCFYLNGEHPAELRGQELTLDEICQISRSFGNLLWLAFSGGEPYVRRDLVDIARVFYEQNRPAIMLFPTNGLLPELIRDRTEQILAHCPRSTVVVKLSLDGLAEDHDALRGTPGGFERLMRTYRQLARLAERHANLELGFNTVFLSQNQDRMDEIIDFVRGLPYIRAHTISLVRGNLLHPSYKEVDAQTYRRATERLARNLREDTAGIHRFRGARLKAAQDIVQRRLIHRTLKEQQRQIPCYAGRLNLVLTETGDVHPCEILPTPLGNVRDFDYDVRRILRTEHAAAVLHSIAQEHCHCTHECYFITNILFNPRLYLTLLHEYLGLAGSTGARAGCAPRPVEQAPTRS